MFDELVKINQRPRPFEFYTAEALWTDAHTSEKMLAFHLNGDIDVSSRNKGFIERSVDFIAKRFRLGPDSRVADFGCGPGLYAARLARTGAKVTGIDFSARSIDYARKSAEAEGLTIAYVNGNYLDFETKERFDLIVMIMCDFCALSPMQRKKLLAKFRGLLKPGGAALFDVYSPAAFAKREEQAIYEKNQLDGFWSAEPYYGFLNIFKYEAEKVVLDKYTIVEKERTRTVYNWLQYFAAEDLEAELAAAGFRVEELLGDVAGSPYKSEADEFAAIARLA